MAKVWKTRGINPPAKMVLLKLADHSSDDGTCYPYLKRIYGDTGYSKATVCRHLADLETMGLIERSPGKIGDGTHYFLNSEKIEELIPESQSETRTGLRARHSESQSETRANRRTVKEPPLNHQHPLTPKGEECVKDLFGDIPTGPPEESPPPKQATIKELSDAIWNNYPKGIGKQRSSPQKVFDAMSKVPASDRPSVELIVVALDAWKKSWAWTKENGDLVMGAARWVNERQWENIPEPAKPKNPNLLTDDEYNQKWKTNKRERIPML